MGLFSALGSSFWTLPANSRSCAFNSSSVKPVNGFFRSGSLLTTGNGIFPSLRFQTSVRLGNPAFLTPTQAQ